MTEETRRDTAPMEWLALRMFNANRRYVHHPVLQAWTDAVIADGLFCTALGNYENDAALALVFPDPDSVAAKPPFLMRTLERWALDPFDGTFALFTDVWSQHGGRASVELGNAICRYRLSLFALTDDDETRVSWRAMGPVDVVTLGGRETRLAEAIELFVKRLDDQHAAVLEDARLNPDQ